MKQEENKPAFVKRDAIVSGNQYAQLLSTLKQRFRKSQIKAAVKVNSEMLEFYWTMGRDISALYKTATYGSAFFDCLSLDLKAEFPGQSGFSATNIKTVFRWYRFYSQDVENRQQLVDDFEMPHEFGEIPWGHHIKIFTKSKSVAEALFYIDKTIHPRLCRQIKFLCFSGR